MSLDTTNRKELPYKIDKKVVPAVSKDIARDV